MKILIVDNNIDRDSWGATELREQAVAAATGATVHVRRAPAEDLPAFAAQWDAIIVSGSKTRVSEEASWISSLDRMIGQALEADIPLLGVCYGHQALARVLSSRDSVGASATPEFGWTRIERLGQDSLWEGLAPHFHSFSWHRDEVKTLPPGTRLLAGSDRCSVQAFAVEGKRARGIQFHPERRRDAGQQSMTQLASSDRANALSGGDVHSDEVGRLIFYNFLQKIAAGK